MATVKASDIVAGVIRVYEMGCGYIWGTHGVKWTEAKQKAGSKENNAKTQAYGSQWIGSTVYDCSGLEYDVLGKLGLNIKHSCNSIWNGYLSEKGTLSQFPPEKRLPGMPVFKTSGSDRHHMGTYIGAGWVVEAKGTQTGVVISKWETWDECGYYKNVDFDLPWDWTLPEFHFDIYPPLRGFNTCRSGSAGASVRYVQVLLHDRWDAGLVVDNYYGSNTIAAVKAFQAAHGLSVDGVTGPMTIAALEKALPIGVDPEPVPIPIPIPIDDSAWYEVLQQMRDVQATSADLNARIVQLIESLNMILMEAKQNVVG